jgi:hypothetical protein
MKALVAVALLCLAPGLASAATLTGSIVDSSASVNLASVGTLDWARWPGYTHGGSAISDVTTTGTFKTYTNDRRSIGDNSGIKVAGPGASFTFTAAATTTERTLRYYIGGWNSTGRVTVTLAGATTYTTTFTSSTHFSRVVTLRFRADSATTLRVTYTQTAGGGSINMQAAALSGTAAAAPAASATPASTTLSWQPPTLDLNGTRLTGLGGFRVYWGTTQGSYPYSAKVGNSAAPTHTVTGLAAGTWYFVVTALNLDGSESGYSNVWSKVVR